MNDCEIQCSYNKKMKKFLRIMLLSDINIWEKCSCIESLYDILVKVLNSISIVNITARFLGPSLKMTSVHKAKVQLNTSNFTGVQRQSSYIAYSSSCKSEITLRMSREMDVLCILQVILNEYYFFTWAFDKLYAVESLKLFL